MPTRSVSDELRSYPADPLAAAPDVRIATLTVEPGAPDAAVTGQDKNGRPGLSTPVEHVDAEGGVAGWLAAAERRLQSLAGGRLTPAVGLLAVLLALLLGAGHAALPGHGKTVLAAYAAGRQGRVRDAVVVGATVTVTHTGGVLVMGLLLTASATIAGDRVTGYLGIVSGALVVAVGIGMLIGLVRRRGAAGNHHHHGHDHHGHGHDHDHDHGHDHAHPHHHGGRPSRWGLAGIGIAGGLVPSPSALVVLLGAIGLGRTGFGVLLVLAYGVGMAATLTATGLLLVAVQRRLARRSAGRVTRRRVTRRLPPRLAAGLTALLHRARHATSGATAGLVVVVGLGLAARAAATVL